MGPSVKKWIRRLTLNQLGSPPMVGRVRREKLTYLSTAALCDLDTLHPAAPVALAHIDGDWYRSVLTCLERIWPWLIVGGVLVIDDYDSWSGCRCAVNDYFAGRIAEYRFERRARLHIVKL